MTHDPQPPASHFIGGDWVEDREGDPMPVIFPATGEPIATLHAATPAIVDRALAAAEAAQKGWARMSGRERGRVLTDAARIMRARNRDLSVLETLDTGKPLSETLVADATSGADALEYFGGLAASLTGDHVQLGANWAYTIREPLGVCVGLGAWNYPTQIACWKAAPALACGNAMVFKPSETTPLCALRVAEILTEAGAPPGLFNVVQGAGAVGSALVSDPRVAKVSLTGSVPTGRRVYAAAAEGMKHVTMELGGKSPLLIFDDADLDDAVSGAILGNFYSTGQDQRGVPRPSCRTSGPGGDRRPAGRDDEFRPDGQRGPASHRAELHRAGRRRRCPACLRRAADRPAGILDGTDGVRRCDRRHDHRA